MNQLNVGVAFIAGIVSFLSPCCLPLYPSYLSFISGVKYQELVDGESNLVRNRVMWNSLGFILGLSMIFFTLGYGAGAVSDWFANQRDLIRQVAALIMVFMGLVLFGVIRIPGLMQERKWSWTKRPVGWFGSVLIGMGFAAGWSPCVGPILSAILALSSVEPGTWFMYVSAYTLGFSLPFLALAWWIGRLKGFSRWSNYVMKGGALLLIFSGVLLYTDQLTKWTIWFSRVAPDWMRWG